jgi:hypothetical protein
MIFSGHVLKGSAAVTAHVPARRRPGTRFEGAPVHDLQHEQYELDRFRPFEAPARARAAAAIRAARKPPGHRRL